MLLCNLSSSKSFDALGLTSGLAQPFYGYVMRFQIGNDTLFFSLSLSVVLNLQALVTMVKSAFVNSKQELKTNVCCMT